MEGVRISELTGEGRGLVTIKVGADETAFFGIFKGVVKIMEPLGVKGESSVVVSKCGDVTEFGLEEGCLGLKQGGLGVEDIELGSCACVEAFASEAEGFEGLSDVGFLAFDGLAGFCEVRDCFLDLEDNFADSVIVESFGLAQARFGLFDLAGG